LIIRGVKSLDAETDIGYDNISPHLSS
jgi:hypothetical protein